MSKFHYGGMSAKEAALRRAQYDNHSRKTKKRSPDNEARDQKLQEASSQLEGQATDVASYDRGYKFGYQMGLADAYNSIGELMYKERVKDGIQGIWAPM
jgi:hypothetical protein